MENLEKCLRKFRNVMENSRWVFGTLAVLSLGAVYCCLLVLEPFKAFSYYGMFFAYIGVGLAAFIYSTPLCYCFIYKYRAHVPGIRVYPLAFTLVKSVLQVCVLAMATILDKFLKSAEPVVTITCIMSIYIHLVTIFFAFKLGEDCDLVSAFLNASFVILYDITIKKLWLVCFLMVLTILLAGIKNMLFLAIPEIIQETSPEVQERKLMHNLRQYTVPLQRYVALMDLQERNERLFYKLLIDNVEELLPVVYTPTVGEACQKYGSIFRKPQGLYISLKEKGNILEVLKNWPQRGIQVIVVTDGERILGLGDLGCQAMGIPVGKLSLYTALGGIRPSACLPITIDVGTNNETLLNDEFYIGLKQRRATGQEYAEFLHEFMCAVKQNYGEKVLVQFEDFANHNAFDLLSKYMETHLVFNDDIQGTASVVLAGLIAAQKVLGKSLSDHTFLFLGAGEAGTGIAELIALEISKETGAPIDKTRKKIWLVDSKGLIVSSRKESLKHFKQPWAHEHAPVKDLISSVNALKPTVLIGTSGVGQTFTKEVVEAMATFNEKPLILALSNPTSQAECTAEQAYTWTKGRAIFGSGSPFDPVEYDGKNFLPGQANNCYIFPGLGLGLIMSGAIRVRDDMLLAASEALADQVTEEHFANGLIYPPFSDIRKISANIAASVAAKTYDLGLASNFPRAKDLVKFAESCMYSP